jgi:hypothetical protein
LTSSEKLAQAARLLSQSKALTAAANTQMQGAKKALEESEALRREAGVLLAEVRGEIVLEGE